MDIEKEYWHLNQQHPRQWTKGAWYPATMSTGREVEIKRVQGRGRNTGKRYLHVRFDYPHVLKDRLTGEVLREYTEKIRFRISHGEWTIAEI